MFRRLTWALALSLTTLALSSSCTTASTISTRDELLPALKRIPKGHSGWLEVEGKLSPYSGSSPKGSELSELSIGSRTLVIHPLAMHVDLQKTYSGKAISARVKVSHLPLSTDNPATQLQGHWITEIKDIKVVPSNIGQAE